eukprot:PhF_6_TR3415/c0_g1_i1/m.4933
MDPQQYSRWASDVLERRKYGIFPESVRIHKTSPPPRRKHSTSPPPQQQQQQPFEKFTSPPRIHHDTSYFEPLDQSAAFQQPSQRKTPSPHRRVHWADTPSIEQQRNSREEERNDFAIPPSPPPYTELADHAISLFDIVFAGITIEEYTQAQRIQQCSFRKAVAYDVSQNLGIHEKSVYCTNVRYAYRQDAIVVTIAIELAQPTDETEVRRILETKAKRRTFQSVNTRRSVQIDLQGNPTYVVLVGVGPPTTELPRDAFAVMKAPVTRIRVGPAPSPPTSPPRTTPIGVRKSNASPSPPKRYSAPNLLRWSEPRKKSLYSMDRLL